MEVNILLPYYPEPHIKWRPEITCYIPYEKIDLISQDKRTRAITTSGNFITRIGSATTEGDEQLSANLAREQKSVDGSGFEVGVISDGIEGYTDSQSTDYLGAVGYIVGHEQMSGREGRAMMEIIHDIAPGAQLTFGSADYGSGDPGQMITTIDDLIGYGSKIIVDDIYWLEDPWFQDGALAQHIYYRIENDDIIYVSAAGNSGETMYTGEFDDNLEGDWHVFYRGDYANIQNSITVGPNETVDIFLQWADEWDEPDTDYDLYLYDGGSSVGTGGKTRQGSSYSNPPKEVITYENDNSNKTLFIQVKRVSGGYYREIKVETVPYDLQYTHAKDKTNKYQVFGHPAADGAISVAAYSAQSTNHVQDYSSRGPTLIYSNYGNDIIRNTPTITATANVATSMDNEDPLKDFNPFDGTSAAAPHIAGIAALYLDFYGYNSNSPENFYAALTSNADPIDGGQGGVWNKKSGYGKANAYETLGGGPINISITVDQQKSNGSSFGSVFHWESDWEDYPVPHTFDDWEEGETHTLRANTTIVDGEKYHDWNENIYLNHNNFTVEAGFTEITAHFDETDPATIKTELISGGEGGSIKLKDPWLTDYNESPYGMRNRGMDAPFKSKPSPLNLTLASEYKGVFLDQDYIDPNKPYYSVGAYNEQQDINGNRWFFGYWQASGAELQNIFSHTSAVVFKQPDAEVSAYYNKGHLLTNLSRAYNHNSQRKLLFCNGEYHTVYIEDIILDPTENAKNILWYTHSATNGFQGDWPQEKKLNQSEYDDEIKNPSMDYYDNTQYVKLYIVYEIGGEYEPDQYYASLLLTEYNTNDGSYSTELIADFYDIQSVDLEPVIARSQYNMFIIWRDPNQNKLVYKHKYLSGQTHQWEWSSITPIPNTTSKSKHPSIVCEKHINQPQHFHLVWDENSGSEIRYYRINPNEVNGDVNFDNYCKISQGGGYSKNRHPSISLNGGNYPVVSWTGAKRSLPPIDGLSKTAAPYGYIYNAVLRSKGSSGWGSFFNTGSGVDYTNCNSSSNANQMETVMTYSKSGGQSCKWIRKVNSSYIYGSLDVNGIQTQLSNGSLSSMKAVVFDNNGSAPHYLKRSDTDFNQGLSKPSAKESTSYARQAVVTKDNIEFVYHIGDVHLGEKYISFYDFPDTVVIKDEDHLNQVTKSKPFYLDSNSELYLSEQYYTVNGDKSKSVLTKTDNIYFKLELVKNDSRRVVALLNDINFNKENIDKLDFTDYKFDCSGMEKGEYFIRIKTNMKGKGKYFVGNEQQNINELQKISYNELFVTKNVLPSTFSLKQNYPNPFNPVTNIAFDLPEDSQVKLMIYSINGQLITTLVDDYRKAGRHEVVFNGCSLASGIYFYRIKAGSFSEIKRMLLVK
jgi:hypothetical protein